MKIAVIGCGYVGLVHAIGLATLGHQVLACDVDRNKINKLKKGVIPFYEPGLQELLSKLLKKKKIQKNKGSLQFTENLKLSLEFSEIVICAVGTPEKTDGEIDLTQIFSIVKAMKGFASKLLIIKSTIPVGTCEIIEQEFLTNHSTTPRSKIKNTEDFLNKVKIKLIFSPEFLREGKALDDFFRPSRVIFGLDPSFYQNRPIVVKKLQKTLKKLYPDFVEQKIPFIFTDTKTAEMVKYASNVFLATKISFANELARVCGKLELNLDKIVEGIGHDPRIGHQFLEAGIGFGGSCLPKDLKTYIQLGKTLKIDLPLAQAVQTINEQQPENIIKILEKKLGSLKGKKIAIWGLSFKPKTDDIRASKSLEIIEKLLVKKALVQAYDPAAMSNVKKVFGKKIKLFKDQYSTTKGADALLVLTKWDQFKKPDYKKLASLMKNKFIIDGRNFLDLSSAKKNGFEYKLFNS